MDGTVIAAVIAGVVGLVTGGLVPLALTNKRVNDDRDALARVETELRHCRDEHARVRDELGEMRRRAERLEELASELRAEKMDILERYMRARVDSGGGR